MTFINRCIWKVFLKSSKNQFCIMKKNIEIYCFTFCSIFINFVEYNMFDNHTCYCCCCCYCCWFLLDLFKKMWLKFIKKYDIDFENSSILNFEEFYTIIVKKTKHIEFEHNFMKTMRENILEKLNYWKKLLMRNDVIIIYVNDMFSSHQQLKLVKKSKLKIILNAVIQSQFNNLNLKAEVFWLDILLLSENLE